MDREAGPVVRPYALTGGRTRPDGEDIDLLAMVWAIPDQIPDPRLLEPEHSLVLECCQPFRAVADLASDLDLPLGVIGILVSDMRERGLVAIRRPPRAQVTDLKILQDVVNGLRKA
jgi:Protein of unknown function (DUF742)